MTSLNHSFFAAAIALAPLVSQSRTPTATTSSVQSFTPRIAGSDPRNRGANPSCSLQFCTEIQPGGIASYCKFFTGFIPVSHSRTKKKKRKEEEEEVRPVACRCSAAMAGSYRRVTIPNKQGLELAGILEEAGNGKGEQEVCILCHGFRSSKDSSTLSSLSKALVEAGMSTFRFDFQGNGESQGEFAYGNYWREVEDLRAVIEYWKAQGRRVETIIGHSKGGNCVVLYASKYHDVPNIVNISGRFSLDAGVMTRLGGQEGLQKLEKDGFLDIKDGAGNVEYRVTKESLEDRLSTDMNAACLAIPKECHVLTIHGAKDEVVPVEDAYKFSQKISTHSLSILDNANHGYRSHQRDLAQCVLDFVKDG